MNIVFAYITVPDRPTAETIAMSLVTERLAACVNIFPDVKSVYRWQNNVEQAEEIVLIAKTTRPQFIALQSYVIAHHPYEMPCIVALPILEGEFGYLKWIETNSAGTSFV